jgi:circadian clock protein KaiC
MRKAKGGLDRLQTGVRNLDELLGGGLPSLTLSLIGGSPGAGKTILSQQLCFLNATVEKKALIVHTLSEPTPKTLRYLQQFDYFDPRKIEDGSIRFVDLGDIMRSKGLGAALAMLVKHLREVRPAFVVIDSFKVFSELATSREEIRKFTYEVAITLMAWECTGFLLGEFTREELQTSPLSSVVDGIMMLTVREVSGEQQRFLQITKMRGTAHDRDAHPFDISSKGVELYVPQLSVRGESGKAADRGAEARAKTGIRKLDAMLGPGIPAGSSILLSGASGTGKTILALEALYRGAKSLGAKGLHVSFEETPDRTFAAARGMGWDLEGEVRRGMIELVYVPQPDILLEKHLLMIRDRVERFKPERIVIDSLSVFLHKIRDPRAIREKTFQLATLAQRAGAIGLLVGEVPFGSNQLSSFGVEEAVVEGIISLRSDEKAGRRHRSLEIYKMRNTDHVVGRVPMRIQKGGVVLGGGKG